MLLHNGTEQDKCLMMLARCSGVMEAVVLAWARALLEPCCSQALDIYRLSHLMRDHAAFVTDAASIKLDRSEQGGWSSAQRGRTEPDGGSAVAPELLELKSWTCWDSPADGVLCLSVPQAFLNLHVFQQLTFGGFLLMLALILNVTEPQISTSWIFSKSAH